MENAAFWLVLAGVLLVAFALFARVKKSPFQTGLEDGQIEAEIPLPQTWDENQITGMIQRYKNRSAVLSHYVSALQERFIIRQDDRTAKARTEFLRTRLEMLKLGKEVQVALDDLRLHEVERDIRQRKLELERRDLENRQNKQDELDAISHERDKLQIKLDIAKTTKDINDILHPPPTPPPKPEPTREEIRLEKKRYWEKRIERIEYDKAEAIFKIQKGRPLQELSEDEQANIIRVSNMYDQAIEEARQEVQKFL